MEGLKKAIITDTNQTTQHLCSAEETLTCTSNKYLSHTKTNKWGNSKCFFSSLDLLS